jgi:putative ABC transport system substrate-binding protein
MNFYSDKQNYFSGSGLTRFLKIRPTGKSVGQAPEKPAKSFLFSSHFDPIRRHSAGRKFAGRQLRSMLECRSSMQRLQEDRMRRREVLYLVGAALFSVATAARAQQKAGSIQQIVFLSALSPKTIYREQLEQFRAGLIENGLIDGQNVSIEYLWGDGNEDIIRAHARALAQRKTDVIVTAGPQMVRALRDAGVQSPVVFAILSDPIGDGIVASLANPGGNVTGLSMAGTDLESKRMEIIKEAVPGLSKVLLLHNPTMGPTALDEAKLAAKSIGIEAVLADTNDLDKIKDLFLQAQGEGIKGAAVMASPFFNFNRKRLTEFAASSRLPSIWESTAYVQDGGLLAYGPSFPDMYRRSAGYVAKILKGAKPADLPVEQPTRFELAINLRTAKDLGLAIPPTLLSRADRVVE